MLIAAFMSGNTVGLAAISTLDLELKKEVGTKDEKRIANRISRVISNHHWMLCTLLFLNAAALESLPIVLEKLMPPTMAVIISVVVVLVFCEIIPMSLCTGPN